MQKHRLTVSFDIEGDAWLTSRLRSDLEEAAAKLNAEYSDDTVERLDLNTAYIAEEDDVDIRDLECTTCKAEARYANPPTDASRWGDVWEPVCLDHVADGYVGLAQFDEVEFRDRLGL